MAQPKFTPGPWSRNWVYTAIRHINKNVDDSYWLGAEERKAVDECRVNLPNVRINPADADLIAAAPEMYEALADCIVSLCAANLEHLPSLAKARAALAKAEGRDGAA